MATVESYPLDPFNRYKSIPACLALEIRTYGTRKRFLTAAKCVEDVSRSERKAERDDRTSLVREGIPQRRNGRGLSRVAFLAYSSHIVFVLVLISSALRTGLHIV